MEPTRRLLGYARVSTADQDPALQLDALNAAGCQPIYVEKASGARRDRPELDRLVADLRPGDTVVVWKLDRLGRSLAHLVDLVDRWCREGVEFRSLTEGIDTSTPAGKLVCHILGSLAEYERSLIRERVMAGQAAAKRRGKHLGRKPTDEDKLQAAALLVEGMGVAGAAKAIGISRQTLWRWMNGRHMLQRRRAASRNSR